MADEQERSGLTKAISSTLVGLISGAILMYVSPLVNSAIKPPKPVPNFAATVEGLQVTFNNRSTGGTQGWWDFGDGSALEPFSPNQASIVHRFPAPGSYNVKLSLNNLIGEETERTVAVRVESSSSPQPSIDEFQVQALSANRATGTITAPATFSITAKVRNADVVLWSIDDQPLDIETDFPQGGLHRDVTFNYYGYKKIRLLAVNGKNRAEKSADVYVDVPEEEPRIMIYPTTVRSWSESVPFSSSIPATYTGTSYPIEITRSVGPEAMILEAHIDQAPSPQLVANPKLLISPDRKTFQIKGDLLRPASVGRGVPPSWFGKVELKLANRTGSQVRRSAPAVGKLQIPGRTLVNLPPAAAGQGGGMQWEVRQGMDVLMKDVKLPAAQVVRLRDRTFHIVVQQVGNQVQIDAAESAATPLLNTSAVRPNR